MCRVALFCAPTFTFQFCILLFLLLLLLLLLFWTRCIFISPETGTFHLLAHTDASGGAEKPMVWPHVSAHAFALDPRGPWTVSSKPPYTTAIEWESGKATTVRTRERPQVIFMDGKPRLLVNGVMPDVNSTPASPHGFTGDYSYTHIQEIGKE